jgi:hypothetical protein
MRRKGNNMTYALLPPTSGDPLADSVLALFDRLKRIDPQHELLQKWNYTLTPQRQPHALADRLHGVVGYFIKRRTDHDLLAVQAELQKILEPRGV